LSELDRRAVVARYFQDKPVAQIALEMNVSQSAAKQRIARALEKLRTRLSRHGTMVSAVQAEALASLLVSHAVKAAPAGLWQSALATASAGAGATGSGIVIAKGAMHMMAWTKAKVAAAMVAICLIGGTGSVITIQHAMGQTRQPAAKAQAAPKAVNKDAPSMETAPPVVVKTIPEAGAVDVDPSITEIKVTYSKDMTDGSWSWSTWGEENMPKITAKPHYEKDKRTCVAPVKLESGKFYAIWLNSNNFGNFRDADGQSAVPYLLVFKTK
jgi:RNA polymerase sigma-70 factor (ECF subfamily)